jgi:peptide chain release factor 1
LKERDLADNRAFARDGNRNSNWRKWPAKKSRIDGRKNASRLLSRRASPADPTDSRNTIIDRAAPAVPVRALRRPLSHVPAAPKRAAGGQAMIDRPTPAASWVIFNVTGTDVYKCLKYESGVHRVQRVPATEAQGRIHTSTCTVAVLPEAQEVDIEIKTEELEINTCRASGKGGQGVNTTDSAVQIIHKPTGLIVRCADQRSQQKNRVQAMTVLRSRLLERKIAQENAKYAAQRKDQVGTGERSEKIRTYNFPQNRRDRFTRTDITPPTSPTSSKGTSMR